MSLYAKQVNIFIHLLKTQPSFFSPEDREELSQLIASQADEIKALANAISEWLETHPDVEEALTQLDDESITRSPGREKSNQNIPQYENNKKELLNSIHQTSSDGKDDGKLQGKVSKK